MTPGLPRPGGTRPYGIDPADQLRAQQRTHLASILVRYPFMLTDASDLTGVDMLQTAIEIKGMAGTVLDLYREASTPDQRRGLLRAMRWSQACTWRRVTS